MSTLEPDSLTLTALFPTPLAGAFLADRDSLSTRLRARILARAEQEAGASASNDGGWHSNEFQSWCGEDGETVLAAAREMADRLTLIETSSGLKPASINWRVTAWANIHRAGNRSREHCHPGAFWSGVFWVDVGDPDQGGSFEIADPRGVLPAMYAPALHCASEDCLHAGSPRIITPQTGMMILFPSWLTHAVATYRGIRPRISIAFNFSYA